MIAVMMASAPVSRSAFWWMCALSVAAIGVGPMLTWLTSLPMFTVKRIAAATALALVLSMLLVGGAAVTGHLGDLYWGGCDYFWWDPICWLFGGG